MMLIPFNADQGVWFSTNYFIAETILTCAAAKYAIKLRAIPHQIVPNMYPDEFCKRRKKQMQWYIFGRYWKRNMIKKTVITMLVDPLRMRTGAATHKTTCINLCSQLHNFMQRTH